MRISDWSSDVCSSDLERVERRAGIAAEKAGEQPRLRAGVRVLIHEEDRPYFGGRIIATKGDPLPRDLEGEQGIASNVGRPMTLAQWAQHITREAELPVRVVDDRSEEHTSELQSLMRISYAVFCL